MTRSTRPVRRAAALAAMALVALASLLAASPAQASRFEVRVKSVMCLKPATGIERGVVKGLRIFTQVAGDTLSVIGPVASLGGPKAKVALAAAETSIAAIKGGADIASAIDRRRDPDDLYLKVGRRKVWPRGKYASMRGGQVRHPNLALPPLRGNRYGLTLMEYDSGSGDDFMGRFSFTPTRAGTFTVDVRGKKEDSAYLVELQVIDRRPKHAARPSLRHLANRTVHIRNRWRCPSEGRCGQHLSFTGKKIKLYPKDNTNDLVPWKLVPVPGKSDEFYLRNRWRCPSEGRCDQHLSFSGQDAVLYPKDNTNDLVPWKFVPVPNKPGHFYIRNRWRCGRDGRCDQHLSFSGSFAKLYPKDNTNDLVPWEVRFAN